MNRDEDHSMRNSLFLLPLLLSPIALADEPAPNPSLVARPEAFQTLVNPKCSHCRDEAKRRAHELHGDDRVLCWIRGYSDGGTIPLRFFLNPYRVISDTYGVFVYDPDAGYARGFAPSLDFIFYGWRNGVMVMKHKDGTLYSCLTGVAFDGPRKGSRLQPVPTLVSDWGYSLERNPGAVAYHMFDKYRPVDLPTALHEGSRRSRGTPDPRLGQDAEVLGVAASKGGRAYPLTRLAEEILVHDEVDGQPCIVLWHAPTRAAAAYRPVASPAKPEAGMPRPLTLERGAGNNGAPFIDKETGSGWDITGRAVSGSLKGWTLEWLDGTQVKWFAWAAEHPSTSIYRPGD
jgi:hypothetical protein